MMVVGAALAGRARAQKPEDCDLNSKGSTRSTTLASGERNTWVGGGVTIVCKARNIVATSDSAEEWGDEGRVFMVGHVHYTEPRLDLHSQYLTYLERTQEVHATIDVIAVTLPSHSVLTGPVVTYLKADPKIRPRQHMDAISNPVVKLVQKDSAGRTDTVTVNASHIIMDGDSLIYAMRQVTIVRADLTATGDSASLDTGKETMRLLGTPDGPPPLVVGRRGRPYRLSGTLIDVASKNKKVDHVVTRGSATAVSADLTLTADTIDMRVANDLLQHAIAWGSSRKQAHAVSPGQSMMADSLDILMPNQRVQTVRALRSAYTESAPDSTRFRTTEHDWLRGDTIVALFDSLAPIDTTRNPPMRLITASSVNPEAKAYYHLAASDTAIRIPAISYVSGRRIALQFANRRVSTVTVRDSVAGIYLEPAPIRPRNLKQRRQSRRAPLPTSTQHRQIRHGAFRPIRRCCTVPVSGSLRSPRLSMSQPSPVTCRS